VDRRQYLIELLDQVEARILGGRSRIARQEKLVQRWQEKGFDVQQPRELLTTLQATQLLHHKHRDALVEELAGLPLPVTPAGVAAESRLGRLLKPVLEEIVIATKFQKGTLQILKQRYLKIECQRGFDAELLKRFEKVDEETKSSCGRAMKLRKPVWIGDVLADDDADYRSNAIRAGFRSVLSQPLIAKSGLFGVVSVHDAITHDAAPADLSHLGEFVADMMARHREN
jgi:transcriptional regulator with GAF, ATPase, and Fis domain